MARSSTACLRHACMSLVLCATAIIACGRSARAVGASCSSITHCGGGRPSGTWPSPMATRCSRALRRSSSFGAPLATVVLEISDHFLALGIDRDDRLISAEEIDRLVVDVTKLCVGHLRL